MDQSWCRHVDTVGRLKPTRRQEHLARDRGDHPTWVETQLRAASKIKTIGSNLAKRHQRVIGGQIGTI